MKTYASAWIVTLFLAGIGSGLHAADAQTVEQALGNWSTHTEQSLELSDPEALQELVQEGLQQLIQDAIQTQQPQLRMRIRLSDEMPIELRQQTDRNAAGNVPVSGKLPESKLPLAKGVLGWLSVMS